MTAKDESFSMNVGETKLIEVDSTDDEDDGGSLDMSGFTSLTWYLKVSEDGPTLVSKDDSSADVTITDASVGAYEIKIQSSDTEGNVSGLQSELFHKVRFVDDLGNTSDLLQGTITVYDT